MTWTWADLQAKSLTGTEGDDTIYGFNGQPSIISGLGGNDYLQGGDQDDAVLGGEGNDRLYGNANSDTLDGAAGDDALYGDNGYWSGNGGGNTLTGGTGNDYLEGDGGGNRQHETPPPGLSPCPVRGALSEISSLERAVIAI